MVVLVIVVAIVLLAVRPAVTQLSACQRLMLMPSVIDFIIDALRGILCCIYWRLRARLLYYPICYFSFMPMYTLNSNAA